MAPVDRTIRFRTLSDRWQAASNCMVPRTFISLAMLLAADDAGVAEADACTTVSTPAASITLATNGFRMSTRAKSAAPIRARAAGSGRAASTPITRSTPGCSASRPARRDPRNLVTPVTRTIRPAIAAPPLRRPLLGCSPTGPATGLLAGLATGHPGLAKQLAMLLLGHPLATLLDDRAHVGDLSRFAAVVAATAVSTHGERKRALPSTRPPGGLPGPGHPTGERRVSRRR